MKKSKFLVIAAIAIVMTATGCRSNQPVAQQQAAQLSIDDEIAALEREARLLHAQANLEIARRDAELRLAQQHQVNITLEWHPCMQQTVNLSGDVLMGFGISDQSRDRTEALLNANAVAIADISSRLLGTVSNGVERYSRTGYTRSGNRLDQSSLQTLASSIGERAFNQMGHVGCREIGICNRTGMFIGYVAIQVPIRDIVDAAVIELERAQLDFDIHNFRNHMRSELERQEEQRNSEIRRMQERIGM